LAFESHWAAQPARARDFCSTMVGITRIAASRNPDFVIFNLSEHP
jgi:hypothetical protein